MANWVQDYWFIVLPSLALFPAWYAYHRRGSRHIDRLHHVDPATAARIEQYRAEAEIRGRMGDSPGAF